MRDHLSGTEGRGVARLLAHCDAFERMTSEPAPDAYARLEEQLGSDLARRLVDALAAKPMRAVA